MHMKKRNSKTLQSCFTLKININYIIIKYFIELSSEYSKYTPLGINERIMEEYNS